MNVARGEKGPCDKNTVSLGKKGGESRRPINLTSGVQSFKADLEGKKFLYSK